MNGAVRSIRDKELNITNAFSGIGFEVTTATGTIRSIKALKADVKDGKVVLRFADGGLEVKLHYTLGVEDRFVEKWLEIKAADGKPYFLKSVVLEDTKTTAFQEIHLSLPARGQRWLLCWVTVSILGSNPKGQGGFPSWLSTELSGRSRRVECQRKILPRCLPERRHPAGFARPVSRARSLAIALVGAYRTQPTFQEWKDSA